MVEFAEIVWMQTCYCRLKEGITVDYDAVKSITVNGHKMPTHRAIAYAKATPYQRARFNAYDAHHVNGRNANLTWDSIEVLTVAKHRKLHKGGQ